jgi:hypothetical protein
MIKRGCEIPSDWKFRYSNLDQARGVVAIDVIGENLQDTRVFPSV